MSLFVLDTDILSLFHRGHPEICRRCNACAVGELAITVISVEEQLSGWYSLLRKANRQDRLANIYQRLADQVQFLSALPILPFPEQAIERYEALKGLRLKIGKMDLRIAAIVLEAGGILVTRNTRDFRCVPDLNYEDWAQ